MTLRHSVIHISEQAAQRSGGYREFYGFGQREGLTSGAMVDLWQGTADVMPIPPSTGEQMQVVSTSSNDTSNGTGAQQIHVHYIDSLGVEQSETKVMNGDTPVLTTATDIRFVQSLHSWAVGSGGVSAGNISISKAGVAATVYNVISAGGNMSLSAAVMVPAGKEFFMSSWDCSATDNTPVSIRLRATSHFGVLLPGIFLFHDVTFLESSPQLNPFSVPRKFPSLSIVKVSALAYSAGAKASASFEGWIE